MIVTNHVPKIDQTKSTTGCCALIDPKEWDEQLITFENKLFAKAKVKSILHVPLNMSSVMRNLEAKTREVNALPDEFITLSDEASLWHSDQYYAVGKEVPGLETVKLSGTFLTKVFEGPYKDAQKWYKQLKEFVESKGNELKHTYFFYTTCPKCSKIYGKNYVVGFAQIA